MGEIDFLGFTRQQRILVVLEAKIVMTGLEGRYWRDDLDQFVISKGSYSERFRRKLSWVSDNRQAIAASLGLKNVAEVGTAMFMLYPCIASELIAGFSLRITC